MILSDIDDDKNMQKLQQIRLLVFVFSYYSTYKGVVLTFYYTLEKYLLKNCFLITFQLDSLQMQQQKRSSSQTVFKNFAYF